MTSWLMRGVRVKRRLLQKIGLDVEGRLSDSPLRGDSCQTVTVSFSFASNSVILPAASALTDTSILSVSIVTTSSAAPALATFYHVSSVPSEVDSAIWSTLTISPFGTSCEIGHGEWAPNIGESQPQTGQMPEWSRILCFNVLLYITFSNLDGRI